MTDLTKLHFDKAACEGPCFYRYSMTVQAATTESSAHPAKLPDTFLDTHGLSKGVAFLNGQALGRFWSVGPEFTLYTPGPWLHAGTNEVVIFDLQGTAREALTTIDHADYGSAAK